MVEEMTFTSRGEPETRRLGKVLGELLRPGNVVFLNGDLGAGKTTFSKGVALGLGVTAEVTSPTFTLAAEYEGRIPFAHLDLYRLYEEKNAKEALSGVGWEDYLQGDYAVLVEWPDALREEVADVLDITITRAPLPRLDERSLRCRATSARSWSLLDEWVKRWLF